MKFRGEKKEMKRLEFNRFKARGDIQPLHTHDVYKIKENVICHEENKQDVDNSAFRYGGSYSSHVLCTC